MSHEKYVADHTIDEVFLPDSPFPYLSWGSDPVSNSPTLHFFWACFCYRHEIDNSLSGRSYMFYLVLQPKYNMFGEAGYNPRLLFTSPKMTLVHPGGHSYQNIILLH